jgi:hypothetical protein
MSGTGFEVTQRVMHLDLYMIKIRSGREVVSILPYRVGYIYGSFTGTVYSSMNTNTYSHEHTKAVMYVKLWGKKQLSFLPIFRSFCGKSYHLSFACR